MRRGGRQDRDSHKQSIEADQRETDSLGQNVEAELHYFYEDQQTGVEAWSSPYFRRVFSRRGSPQPKRSKHQKCQRSGMVPGCQGDMWRVCENNLATGWQSTLGYRPAVTAIVCLSTILSIAAADNSSTRPWGRAVSVRPIRSRKYVDLAVENRRLHDITLTLQITGGTLLVFQPMICVFARPVGQWQASVLSLAASPTGFGFV